MIGLLRNGRLGVVFNAKVNFHLLHPAHNINSFSNLNSQIHLKPVYKHHYEIISVNSPSLANTK